jgi:hypothetical protein
MWRCTYYGEHAYWIVNFLCFEDTIPLRFVSQPFHTSSGQLQNKHITISSFPHDQSMMTVKGWSRGPAASQIGKPAVHMASVDLKGKAYE